MKKGEKHLKETEELSGSKKKIFWLVTILMPLIFLGILEIVLMLFNYGGNLDLFIDGPEGYDNYLRCNRDVGKRYFVNEASVPTPPIQLFLKDKPENGYRIFVLGGSSAAGFPFRNNASFPNILERALANTFPNKRVEVINLAMSAVNSYTLLDFADEVIEHSPDALLIYAGHNEFYGALGVGSVQSLGSSRWLINTYLDFQSFKIVLLMRDFVSWVKGVIAAPANPGDVSGTLMSRIVGEQIIPFGSELYESGKLQFEENMRGILTIAKDNNIPVVLSELVSNLKDQRPLVSEESDNSASDFFDSALVNEVNEDYALAKKNYTLAKDYDGLRFRASEEMNDIIHKLGDDYSCPVVPLVSYFENASPNGLIGSSLILEHLHPNIQGYNLIANAFYETLKTSKIMGDNWSNYGFEKVGDNGVTDLDSVYAALVIKRLKQSWPFKPKTYKNRFNIKYVPKNYIEQVAMKVIKNPKYNLEAAHMDLGKHYEKLGEIDNALAEYQALITSIPHEISFYEMAVTPLLRTKRFDEANRMLVKSLDYKENYFAYKWIGQIALIKEDYEKAIANLNKADIRDPQVLFNLSRAYYQSGVFQKAMNTLTDWKLLHLSQTI